MAFSPAETLPTAAGSSQTVNIAKVRALIAEVAAYSDAQLSAALTILNASINAKITNPAATANIADGAITYAKAAADLKSQIPGITISGSRQLLLTDAGKRLVSTAATALVIPKNTTVALPQYTSIPLLAGTSDAFTVAPASGVNLDSIGGNRTVNAFGSACELWQDTIDHWWLLGDVKA